MVNKATLAAKSKTYQRPNWSRAPTMGLPHKRFQPSLTHQTVSKGPEVKDRTIASTGLVMPLTATFSTPVLMNGITQGVSGASQRVGRKVLFKSLLIRYAIQTSSTVASFRLLVIYDKQTNGALPAVTDVLATTAFHAPMNLDNSDRFIVIFDKIINIQDVNMDSLYRKIQLEEMFSGATNVIADITTGSIFHMYAPVATGSTATLDMTTRLRFTDQ